VRLVIFVAALGLHAAALRGERLSIFLARPLPQIREPSPYPRFRGRGRGAVASQLVNSNRLVIRGEADDLAYLADAQWADRLPHLVQASLIARLRERGVDAAFPGAAASYQIATELRRFEMMCRGGAQSLRLPRACRASRAADWLALRFSWGRRRQTTRRVPKPFARWTRRWTAPPIASSLGCAGEFDPNQTPRERGMSLKGLAQLSAGW